MPTPSVTASPTTDTTTSASRRTPRSSAGSRRTYRRCGRHWA